MSKARCRRTDVSERNCSVHASAVRKKIHTTGILTAEYEFSLGMFRSGCMQRRC